MQARDYTEGTISVTVLDSTSNCLTEMLVEGEHEGGEGEGAVEEQPVLGEDGNLFSPRTHALSARESLIRVLHLGLKERANSSRLHVASVQRTSIDYRADIGPCGVEAVPATRLVVGIRVLAGEVGVGATCPPAQALEALKAMHASGALAETLGISKSAIEEFQTSAASEEVFDSPTLLDMRLDASGKRSKLKAELGESTARLCMLLPTCCGLLAAAAHVAFLANRTPCPAFLAPLASPFPDHSSPQTPRFTAFGGTLRPTSRKGTMRPPHPCRRPPYGRPWASIRKTPQQTYNCPAIR